MYRDRSKRGTLEYEMQVFGESVLGAPLEVITPGGGDPELLVLAGQHGDEPETTALLSSVVRSIEPHVLKASVVLALNPDGLARGTRANARGIDLNRNFPTENWSSEDVCYRWSDDSPRDVVLGTGASPGSEPETTALLSLIDQIKPSAVVTLHAPLACVDDPDASPLGSWLAEECNLPLVSDIGYPTPGSFGTWAGEKGLSVITFELPHASIEEHKKQYAETFAKLLCGQAPQ